VVGLESSAIYLASCFSKPDPAAPVELIGAARPVPAGGTTPISHRDLVKMLIEVAGSGRVTFVAWPPDKKRIDIGSFYTDSSKFRRTVGWEPIVELREGLTRTVQYYRGCLDRYVDPPQTAVVTT